jgi:hypothetical protein
VSAGWADDDEAALAILGHEAVGEPMSEMEIASTEPGVVEDEQAEQPANARGKRLRELPMGNNLRAEIAAQVGDISEYDAEAAEWLRTPAWMQIERRRGMREAEALNRAFWLQSLEGLMNMPDADWEAAEQAESPRQEPAAECT